MTRKGVALPPLFSAEQQPEALTEELHVQDIDTRGASAGRAEVPTENTKTK